MSTFEIVRGVEGDCLVLDDTRICGPKPWGGGRIIKTFCTDGIYEVIDKDEYRKMLAENAKLRELVDESDEELYLDIAQGLFDDLMAVDKDKAELWARAWPELFGKDEDDGCDLV